MTRPNGDTAHGAPCSVPVVRSQQRLLLLLRSRNNEAARPPRGFNMTKPAHPIRWLTQRGQEGVECRGLDTASLPWMLWLNRICPARPSPWEQEQRAQP